MDTTYLEEQITRYEGFIEDRSKKMAFMAKQQKEDSNILKQLKKSLENLKEANQEKWIEVISKWLKS